VPRWWAALAQLRRRIKDYRAAFSVSGAKDDRTDAQLLEEFVRLHRDKLKALEPDTELTRMLAGLVENWRHLFDERTRIVNQLHSTLKTYYPLAETLLGRQMNQPIAADFLARWPDLESLRKAGSEKLRAFCYKHNTRNSVKIEEPPGSSEEGDRSDHRLGDHQSSSAAGDSTGQYPQTSAPSHSAAGPGN
jgi:hypothetical protein